MYINYVNNIPEYTVTQLNRSIKELLEEKFDYIKLIGESGPITIANSGHVYFSIKENDEVTLFTDSSYVKNGITSWIVNWKKNNWKNSQKKEVKNKDLWIKLDFLNSNRNVTWKWVKAHDVNEHNNRVDLLAREAAEKLIKSSFDGV